MKDFWIHCKTLLEGELTPQQYQTWIKPLSAIVNLENEESIKLVIMAPNRFKLNWVKNQFAGRITDIAHLYFDLPINISFELIPDSAQSSSKENSSIYHGKNKEFVETVENSSLDEKLIQKSADKPINFSDKIDSFLLKRAQNSSSKQTSGQSIIEKKSSISHANQQEHTRDHSKLNPLLTFDNFVTGKANQLARAAAIQVAQNPGESYNPLFLYSGVGLGKTHLIHAIGNQLLEERPNAKIRYIHAEQYVSDVVKAYQRKAFDEFKRYYHSLHLLLIDDIQFFSGKSRTQEEFFYAFEALIASKAQLIITSDTYPKEISGIDDRLISRFGSGLTVAIEPPELEMRVAILVRKAKIEQQILPEEVAFFVAKHLRSNVRELEGALRKILAYARFHSKEITIELTREALKDLLSVQNRQISVENIQKTVAEFYNIKIADMYSKKRPANIARPRQIAMYLAKELTQKSLPEIGELFGGRDHTTVLHAVRKIIEERSKNSQLNHELHVLEQTLKG